MTDLSVDILICTFRRPGIEHTLQSLGEMTLPEATSVRIIVADNDEEPSAEEYVREVGGRLPFPVTYVHAPARNLSIARNACLDAATGDWVAFIDDDEIADPGWLSSLLARAHQTGADAIFGPSFAEYGPDSPIWISAMKYHSNVPERRGDIVETGHTCNALLRWARTDWQSERFELSRGRSGGEDTEFFFRLGRLGARYEIAEDAIVREPVVSDRLNFTWIRRRKFRMGQSYASTATTPRSRIKLFCLASSKALISALCAIVFVPSAVQRNYWALRAVFHTGVCAGCLKMRQSELYG